MVDLGAIFSRPREVLGDLADAVSGDASGAAATAAAAMSPRDGIGADLLDTIMAPLSGGGGGHVHAHGHGIASRFGLGFSMGDVRNMLFWFAIFAALVACAVVTNPSESSFRTHLTELSFRRHLADIRSDDANADSNAKTDNATDGSNANTNTPNSASTTTSNTADRASGGGLADRIAANDGRRGSLSGTETPPVAAPAPFRFANHVAISLRTPTLLYKTLFLFSLAFTAPPGPPAFLSDPPSKAKAAAAAGRGDRVVVYVGYFGHWSLVGIMPTSVEWVWKLFMERRREKGRKKGSMLDRPGVLEMRAVSAKDDSAAAAKIHALGHASPAKGRPNDAAPAETNPPLHSVSAAIPVTNLIESRRGSVVNLIPAPTAPAALAPVVDKTPSPHLPALKAELSAAQTAIADLRNQLLSLEQSASDSAATLQTSLDELRNRRKEDDAERQELKAKTKNLEEQKRQAEGARREAEKKLRAAEGARDAMKAKISAALNDVEDTKGNMELSEKSIRFIQEDGARHIIETREACESKRRELEEVEESLAVLEKVNEELSAKVREAEDKLKTAIEAGEKARAILPEEEMMMMAQAYEVAAAEGYWGGASSGLSGGQLGAQPPGQSNSWANQAAAYMAEAGMPYLDQSYTARSTSGSGVHPSANNSTSSGQYGNIGLGRSDMLGDANRLADITGFEDFGPGAVSQPTAIPGRRAETPPISDSESDIYGPHDPGSPNGGISSTLSANLLPQGLFRSLEGDSTPLDEDGSRRATLAEALEFDPTALDQHLSGPGAAFGQNPTIAQLANNEQHDSGSEASSDDIWRSPLAEPRVADTSSPIGGLGAGQRHTSGSAIPTMGSRFGGAGSTPPAPNANTTVMPNLPALPALPSNRRWVSGTGSTENLHNFTFLHPTTSSDSLALPTIPTGAPYEPSPFAPSASEKKALAAGKWGPLSKYRWSGLQAGGSSSDAPGGTALSTSPGTSGCGGASSWLSSRFASSSSSGSSPAGGNPFGSVSSGLNGLARTRSGEHFPQSSSSPHLFSHLGGSDQHAQDRSPQAGGGGEQDQAGGGKKPFRFLSLRRPGSKDGQSSGHEGSTGSGGAFGSGALSSSPGGSGPGSGIW